jgi:putative tryptophan/tyrosine transport system substrate-binding protein
VPRQLAPCQLRRSLLQAGLAAAWLGPGVAGAADPLLWVVAPDQTGPYAEALAALRDGLTGTQLRSLSPAQLPAAVRDGAPALVITLGSAALTAALGRASADPLLAQVPVAAGLLPRSSVEALPPRGSPPLTAVWLDPAVERHLDLIRLALPTVKRVGVLWGPSSRLWRPALQRAATERGLQLIEAEPSDTELFPALSQVLGEADVFLALPDNAVFTPTRLNNMLIAAYRQRVPVVGYAATHVRAGAVLALYTEPHQVGRELAQLARRVLAERRAPPPAPSRLWRVGLNDQVARSLGLVLPEEARLTQALQRSEGRP